MSLLFFHDYPQMSQHLLTALVPSLDFYFATFLSPFTTEGLHLLLMLNGLMLSIYSSVLLNLRQLNVKIQLMDG